MATVKYRGPSSQMSVTPHSHSLGRGLGGLWEILAKIYTVAMKYEERGDTTQ